ncbi:hypothetical protein JL720_17159 [Aureococcus anophagefferens]|nr:hypothetical protein JL720_17159 [Aureococcus anophagefferens]
MSRIRRDRAERPSAPVPRVRGHHDATFPRLPRRRDHRRVGPKPRLRLDAIASIFVNYHEEREALVEKTEAADLIEQNVAELMQLCYRGASAASLLIQFVVLPRKMGTGRDSLEALNIEGEAFGDDESFSSSASWKRPSRCLTRAVHRSAVQERVAEYGEKQVVRLAKEAANASGEAAASGVVAERRGPRGRRRRAAPPRRRVKKRVVDDADADDEAGLGAGRPSNMDLGDGEQEQGEGQAQAQAPLKKKSAKAKNAAGAAPTRRRLQRLFPNLDFRLSWSVRFNVVVQTIARSRSTRTSSSSGVDMEVRRSTVGVYEDSLACQLLGQTYYVHPDKTIKITVDLVVTSEVIGAFPRPRRPSFRALARSFPLAGTAGRAEVHIKELGFHFIDPLAPIAEKEIAMHVKNRMLKKCCYTLYLLELADRLRGEASRETLKTARKNVVEVRSASRRASATASSP